MSKQKARDRKAAKEKKESPDPQPEESDEDKAMNALMSEIEADLRDEQMHELWDRYKNVLFAGIAVIFLGVSGYQYLESVDATRLAEQADRFAVATDDLDAGNIESALADLERVAAEGGNYGALAQLRRAAVMIEQGNTAQALDIYRTLSNDASLDFAFADLATVLWALHGMDTEDPEVLLQALAPLTDPSNAFTYSALELTAVLEAKQGDIQNAINILDGLAADSNAPSAVKARAEELSAVYRSSLALSSSS